MTVRPGRWTHDHEGGLVVFLIGMRVNRWHRVDAWWPVFTAMPRMLRELAADPSSGLLGHRMTWGARGPLLVQYWAGHDQLMAYARSGEQQHRPAWRAFNARAARTGGAVGIWHETYVVPAGGHESVYTSMPVQGLALATSSVAAGAPERKRS